LGQLLVVVHHTDTSPSLCYEPELIPDPLSSVGCTAYLGYTLNGSGIRTSRGRLNIFGLYSGSW